jgi:XTP/dITP diphosphohydrolase
VRTVRQIVLATANPHKLREMKEILAAAGVDVTVRGLDEFPDAPEVTEDGETFAANARKKAGSAARATGQVAVADDSGLEVDALGGAPGVLSARYAGRDGDYDAAPSGPRAVAEAAVARRRLVVPTSRANNAKLLRELDLKGVPDDERTARFVCVIAVAAPGRETRLFRGESEGRITRELRGGGGFGYDPLFHSDHLGKTFAEAAPSEKHAVSHRGRALAKFAEALAAGGLDDWFLKVTTDEHG